MAKLIVYGADRAEAIDRARAAVAGFEIVGPKNNLPFFAELLDNAEFVSGDYDTGIVSPDALNAKGPRRHDAAGPSGAFRSVTASRPGPVPWSYRRSPACVRLWHVGQGGAGLWRGGAGIEVERPHHVHQEVGRAGEVEDVEAVRPD